jgi:hypothetical protein
MKDVVVVIETRRFRPSICPSIFKKRKTFTVLRMWVGGHRTDAPGGRQEVILKTHADQRRRRYDPPLRIFIISCGGVSDNNIFLP